ncbi:MAG: Uma2 family endonuclease [Chloroflexota bacterium]|nr:Uma2 family endonuclease [Chloroflexota bacterium]
MAQAQLDLRAARAALWPPDDTEESIVGSEYHQHVIDAARDGLRMAARSNGASWRVLSQVPLAGFRRPDGSPYPMLPDVFVHPRPNPHPGSGQHLTFVDVGVPLLAIEVLSETTYHWDIDEERGKA